MGVKICECCGKRFFSRSSSRKYCCDDCAKEMKRRRQMEDGQICWRCDNACGGCCWSSCFKPVNGWVAERTIVKDSNGDFSSYRIKKCPEFTRG